MSGKTGKPGKCVTSLILPTYNPGAAARSTWERLHAFLHDVAGDWEIVFVCDGCTDGTPERLRDWTRRDAERVRIVSYKQNRGKGFAVYRGLSVARGQWRIFTDMDLAYPLTDILKVAQQLQAGAKAVAASRLHPDSQVCRPAELRGYVLRRQLQSRLFSALVRRLLPLPIRDTQAGLKGFSAALLEQILPYLRCRGFEFDCELLLACVQLGVPIVELPVTVHYDSRSSTTNLRQSLRMLRGIWRMRRAGKFPFQPRAAIPTPVSPTPAVQGIVCG